MVRLQQQEVPTSPLVRLCNIKLRRLDGAAWWLAHSLSAASKYPGYYLWNYGLRVGGGALQRRASGRNSGTKNLLQQHTADEHLISKSSQNISK
jgi:hypothetical protein